MMTVAVTAKTHEHQKPFVWLPGELPFFVKSERVGDLTLHCPESAKVRVDRVEQNVPCLLGVVWSNFQVSRHFLIRITKKAQS